MKARQLFLFLVIFTLPTIGGFCRKYDKTGFFTTEPPQLQFENATWTASNQAISIQIQYDSAVGALLLTQIEDVERGKTFLDQPSPLLNMTSPDGKALVDLSRGWDLVKASKRLRTRKKAKGKGVKGLDYVLRSREVPDFAAGAVTVKIKVNLYPGNEPYITIEPCLDWNFGPRTHALMVQYANLDLSQRGEWKGFGDQAWHAKEQAFSVHSNLHTFVPRDGNGGLWVSIGNYNPRIETKHGKTTVQAEANVYLDQYLPLTGGSLGTWMLGVYSGSPYQAQYDYQLFLIKRWIAGNHSSLAPHLHDYWYGTKNIQEPQGERMKRIAPAIKESGFRFFWHIYDKHGVWPDWRQTPEQFFPGGVDASNPDSVPGALAKAGIPIGLYTAPCRLGAKYRFSLQHDLCRQYGHLLGEKAREANATIWWYEDHPGENYEIEEATLYQPEGNCSWMWRQGFMITRKEIQDKSPKTKICRTWVDSAEQLGWAEGCSCLDVYGSKGGNQSGGETVAADFSLADNWRNAVWGLVPVWPLMHHIGHHPVHIRNANRKDSDSDYIDSSAAMMGPFALNGPVELTTPAERALHKKWADFNWNNRKFLQFSSLPEFIGDAGKVDGIYHLTNPNKKGLCGFIGLWNKDDEQAANITLSVQLDRLRLRWEGQIVARGLNRTTEIPIRIEKDRAIVGPVAMKARDWQVIEISCKK